MKAKGIWAATLMLAVGASRGFADESTLTFSIAGKPVAQFSKKELSEKIKSHIEKFFDPRYGNVKSYYCLPIRDVMNLAYGPGWKKFEYTEAVLTALDGYASVSNAQKLAEDGGCLAVGDAEFPNWEPVGRKGANPGPFYLSWSGEFQSTENEYPWPYQLASINLVKFDERYPEVVPSGAPKDSAAYRGYRIFKGQCMRCHSMNQQGGKIGPDLNAPQSITAYRSKEMIKAFIRQPSKFRYTEMPDHAHLSDSDLEDLYQYFLFKGKWPESDARFIPHYCDDKTAEQRSEELKNLFQADQSDRDSLEGRSPLTGNPMDMMKHVDAEDFQRRTRVAEIFAEGCFKTADDYYHAAMIFQHGNVPDHFFQAHVWASRAAKLGKHEARWLSAASLDRYLMNLGYKQIYATQAQTETNDPKSCWCLWPVEDAATEQMRRDYGVKTIEQQMAWLGEMNKSKNNCHSTLCQKEARPILKGSISGVSW